MLKKKKKRSSGLDRYNALCAERDKESMRATFMYVNMQKWAGENYDRDMAAAEKARQDYVKYVAEKKKQDLNAQRDKERALMEEDRLATQEVYRLMRQAGLVAGTNPPATKLVQQAQLKVMKENYVTPGSTKKVNITAEEMTLPPDTSEDTESNMRVCDY